MLDIKKVLDIANKAIQVDKTSLDRAKDLFYGISLHTRGAVPKFTSLKRRTGFKNPPEYLGEQYQYLFDNYLLNRHPREAEETRDWRYSQYRPFTESAFIRVIELIQGGIFQDGAWDLRFTNEDDREYVFGNNFDGLDIIGYFNRSISPICEDANGYFLRIPKQSWSNTFKKVEPEIWFVHSEDVRYVDADDFLFERNGFLWWVNRQTIFRFEKIEGTWKATKDSGYFAHMFGYLPIDIAGGRWCNGYYKSWLSKAKPIADEFISNKSSEQLINKEATHPYIVQAAPECPSCNGLGEVQADCDTCEGGKELRTCGTCHGHKTISFNPADRLEVPAEMMGNDLVKIINHDVAANKHYKDLTDGLFEQMLDALNLLKTMQAQSGIAKALDQEKAHLFLVPINNDIWDRLIFNSVRDIIAYRNVRAENGRYSPAVYDFTVVKPMQFSIKTSYDLLLEYNEGAKANLPAFVRSRLMLDYINKQFSGDEITIKKAKVISQIDDLCVLSETEIQSRLLYNICDIEDAKFSSALPKLLDELIATKGDDWFVDAEIKEIEELSRELFDSTSNSVILPNVGSVK